MKLSLFFLAGGAALLIGAYSAPVEHKGDLVVCALMMWMLALFAYTFK